MDTGEHAIPSSHTGFDRLALSERALRDGDRTTRVLLNATDDTALLIDTHGTVLALNETASRRLGKLAGVRGETISPDAYVGQCVYALFPDGLAEQRRARNEEVLRTRLAARYQDERDGRWTDNSIYPVLDEDGNVTRLAIFSADVTERKLSEETLRTRTEQVERLNESLEQALADLAQSQEALREKSVLLQLALEDERDRARRDGLTGVLNHGAIMALLRERLLEGRRHRFTLAMVDVDDMKRINDTLGHQVGDAALIQVASALGRENVVVGRYGGDEFVVLLPDADRAAAARYKNQVYERLGLAAVIDSTSRTTIPVAVSIGFAVCPDEADTIAELIARSDVEMYAAKRQRPRGQGETVLRRLAS